MNQQTYCFYDRNSLGSKGQAVVERYLHSLDCTLSIEDVSNNQDYWGKGIDFLWETHSGHSELEMIINCEVKTDTWMARTGNFFIETVSNSNTNSSGWIHYSEAAALFYLSWDEKLLYDLNMQDLRKYLFGGDGKLGASGFYREKSTSTYGANREILFETKGLLVPRADIIKSLDDVREIDVSMFY